jgi:outer membrane lipoprotein-sorting protein
MKRSKIMSLVFVIIVFIILVILLSSKLEKDTIDFEDNLKNNYSEITSIGYEQYLALDSFGNVHLITYKGLFKFGKHVDKIIFHFQDIESSLKRDFKKEDTNRY